MLRGRFNLIVVVLAGWTLALAAEEPAVSVPFVPRPVEGTLELQVELHRRGFSCGSIDGVAGGQTAAALRAFQRSRGLPESGAPDRATLEQLPLSAPALLEFVPDEEERTVRPLPETWLGKSREPALVQSSVLEAVAERFRAHPRLLQRLNPGVEWEALPEGAAVTVPAVEYVALPRHAAAIHIKLAARELELVDDVGRVLAHFPVSIARKVEKRPQGELRVRTAAREPNYTFDPEHFPDAPEAKDPGRKLVLPPGPNNPVGRVWIGLDRPGYGIHGTPEPEKVGRTESLGCFRLANWDALALIDVVRVGMVVWVDE